VGRGAGVEVETVVETWLRLTPIIIANQGGAEVVDVGALWNWCRLTPTKELPPEIAVEVVVEAVREN
jgi:hypothetical protein